MGPHTGSSSVEVRMGGEETDNTHTKFKVVVFVSSKKRKEKGKKEGKLLKEYRLKI